VLAKSLEPVKSSPIQPNNMIYFLIAVDAIHNFIFAIWVNPALNRQNL